MGQVCVECVFVYKKAVIFFKTRAYDRVMRKTLFAISLSVITLFLAAVSVCAHALQMPQAVFGEETLPLKIVIDAGHGGMDGGVVGRTTKVKESDLNLSISLHLKDALEEIGFEVALTRKTSAGLYGAATNGFKRRDMLKREEIIKKFSPSLVISVHQNFYPSHSTRGAQVFYRKNDENSRDFALCLQEKLNGVYAEEKVRNRNVMPGEFFILECAPVPSVIVEYGFLSNVQDEKLLLTTVWQQKLAKATASGVVAYLAEQLS